MGELKMLLVKSSQRTLKTHYNCPREGGGSPYNGLYGEALPERGTFIRLQVYERVEILLVEVYERVGKSVIWVCERAQWANR